MKEHIDTNINIYTLLGILSGVIIYLNNVANDIYQIIHWVMWLGFLLLIQAIKIENDKYTFWFKFPILLCIGVIVSLNPNFKEFNIVLLTLYIFYFYFKYDLSFTKIEKYKHVNIIILPILFGVVIGFYKLIIYLSSTVITKEMFFQLLFFYYISLILFFYHKIK